jgi:hypothetical protein
VVHTPNYVDTSKRRTYYLLCSSSSPRNVVWN